MIRLAVWSQLDLEAFEVGTNRPLYRITANVRILTPAGWSSPREGIVDTGNPLTVIPRRVWAGSSVDFLTRTSRAIHGIGSTEASAVRGRLGRVVLSVEDEEASSSHLRVVAYLLDDDRAPLLLGCEGILTRAILRVELAARQASLEF